MAKEINIDKLVKCGIDNPQSAAAFLAMPGMRYGMASPEVGAVMHFMDADYLDQYPNAAQEWAEQLLDDAAGPYCDESEDGAPLGWDHEREVIRDGLGGGWPSAQGIPAAAL